MEGGRLALATLAQFPAPGPRARNLPNPAPDSRASCLGPRNTRHGPVFYLAFETNAVEPPLIRPHIRKPKTHYRRQAERSPLLPRAFSSQMTLYVPQRVTDSYLDILEPGDSEIDLRVSDSEAVLWGGAAQGRNRVRMPIVLPLSAIGRSYLGNPGLIAA